MDEALKALANPWIAVGLAGQLAFALRFLLQWIASEKKRRSVVPVAFWYCSILGALLLLVYAILDRDPVIFIGQLCGFFVYARNLIFLRRAAKEGPCVDGSRLS